MPASRARTAICSAPLECPSSPGLPTRIFSPRPSCSATRATSSRSSTTSSVDGRRRRLADAGRRAVGAERVAQALRPLAGRHARARGRDRRRHDVLVGARATRASSSSARRDRRRRRARRATRPAPRPARPRPRDRRRGSRRRSGQRRRLGLDVAVDADQHLLAGLDPRDPLAVRLDQRRLHVRHRLDRAALLVDAAPSPSRAPSSSSSTSPSITFEPSNMSGYSSRSVS